MAFLALLFVLVHSLIQYPQPAGDGLDEATHRRMQERQELLDREMARLLQELEQQDKGWGTTLFGALQQWPFWVLAGLLLLLGLWFSSRRRSCEASSSSKNQSSCKTLGDERGKDQEEESVDSEEGREDVDVTVEADDSSSGNEREGSPVAEGDEGYSDEGSEGENKDVQVEQDKDAAKEGEGDGKEEKTSGANMEAGNSDDVNEGEGNVEGKEEYTDVKVQESSDTSEQRSSEDGKEERGSGGIGGKDTRDVGNRQGILLVDRIQWPVEKLETGCSVTAELMESLTRVFVDSISNSFYPVPEEAIGVGCAFEGWSPREWDGVYRVLVPLNPPPGHAFHLEVNSAGQMAARTFRVRVELVCTCKREQLGQELLCFLHHPQKEQRQRHKRSLLQTLCTGSYLDVEKTSHWFSQLVRSSWLHVPQSHSWPLVIQPGSRSCQCRLSKGNKNLTVEMLLGVRQGDSDVFVVSQAAEAGFMASTAWPETFAVAEAKFFQHIARQVPCESLHLKCLQVFTCILRGTGFSSSIWKTVVMHVLTTVPLSKWQKKEFPRRLWDIMSYLGRCLQLKCLDHFVLGNKRLPAEISLPPAMQKVEPLNLFEHLAQDPAAHREAMQAYGQLRFRLWVLLSSH